MSKLTCPRERERIGPAHDDAPPSVRSSPTPSSGSQDSDLGLASAGKQIGESRSLYSQRMVSNNALPPDLVDGHLQQACPHSKPRSAGRASRSNHKKRSRPRDKEAAKIAQS